MGRVVAMVRAAAMIVALTALGCTSRATLEVAMPALEGGASAVLVATSDSRTRAWAFDPDRPGALPGLADEGAIELAVASFDFTLGQLGLVAGELDITSPTTGRTLMPPVVAFEARVDGEDVAWTRRDELPAALRGVRLDDATGPCVRFRVRGHTIPRTGLRARSAALVAIEPGRVLVGTAGGDFYVSSREALEPQPAMTGLPGLAAARSRDGEIWLVGEDGRTARGTIAGGFAPGPRATGTATLTAVSPVPGSTRAIDLMVVSSTGDLFRFDGVRWQTLVVGDAAGGHGRGIAALASDHVLLAAFTEGVRRYRAGAVTEEDAYPDRAREIIAVAHIPGVGVVACASVEGRCLVDRGDRAWSFLGAQHGGPDGLGIDVNELQPYGAGFWAGGSSGAHTQWYPDWGFCDLGPALAPTSVTRALVLGETVVVTTNWEPGVNPTVAWLDPAEPR